MADPRLLTSHDYTVPYDHGQFWLSSCLCVEEDYPLDVVPLPDYDEMAGLDYREIQDEGVWQIPVEYSFSGMLVVLSPHQANFQMPLRVEVRDRPPPDDLADWPEAFEAHLEVDPRSLHYSSTTEGSTGWAYHPVDTKRLSQGAGSSHTATPGSPTRATAGGSACGRPQVRKQLDASAHGTAKRGRGPVHLSGTHRPPRWGRHNQVRRTRRTASRSASTSAAIISPGCG
jgi:hypothetical protein